MEIITQVDQKEEALQEFRKSMSSIVTRDHTNTILMRFLRANNFDRVKAERNVREYVNYAAAFQPGNIGKLWEKHEKLQNYDFMGELGFAKDGTPIRYIATGRGDFRGYMLSLDMFDIGRYCASSIEKDLKRCREQSKKLGKDINEITYIIDMDSFTSRQVFCPGVMEVGLDLLRVFQDYYPEVWKRVLIVNAPNSFNIAFNLFKPIFKRSLLKNIQVASKDSTAQTLLKFVDSKVLPIFLGGEFVDSYGDPRCSEFITFGGRIPDSFFLRNRTPLLQLKDPDVKEVWLFSKNCYNHSVVVKQPNSTIRIEFRTEKGSITFNILYREFESNGRVDIPEEDEYLNANDEECNVQAICPTVHPQSHLVPTDNQFLAVNPGIYIMRFENSHNWLASRRLLYRIRVLPPKTL